MMMHRWWRRRTLAVAARERLQVLLAHERTLLARPDLLPVLQAEILAVLARHITLNSDNVTVSFGRTDAVSTLEIDVEIPNGCKRV